MASLAWLVVVGVGGTFAGCLGDSTPASEQNDTSEAPVCAAGSTVNGIDVSYYQGTIDWTKAKSSGIDFASGLRA